MDRSVLAAGVIALVGVGLAAVAWPTPTAAPPVEIVSAAVQRTVTVHVSGAVLRPGLVILPAEARVADAIAAAGGATVEADLGALNLAAGLSDGSRVVVPGSGGPGFTSAVEGVRVNGATAQELESLPGVGPVLAARIVAYRQGHGPFESVEDLLDVPGIGESKLAALRDVVLVP